jgi:hypothetical protein
MQHMQPGVQYSNYPNYPNTCSKKNALRPLPRGRAVTLLSNDPTYPNHPNRPNYPNCPNYQLILPVVRNSIDIALRPLPRERAVTP